ncbi:gamma-glutamyl-gamma-aminobutyrate hydrolase family protein [Paramaledivibacter caminithermalis]|uniref:Putative glutamine amidotransferase n=1 Tax=Paramaledivibacter caminithermalis (strain DSM 15212 / CIP 107654 / DViRD3) TaxID=1121301 RepID=A0A1M6LR02_PARC5|nr:gamma-glutamyl-gamma-aminobutyrate hydrolase family protein [Paramaledivibacter caminithermalis]SHJ73623.1 putative glutamine amidotransferase [Paramaledivibacter caminithermalis DSM 15212]
MKPLIGITTYYVRAFEIGENRQRGQIDQDMLMATMDYLRAVEKVGGIPLALPVSNKEVENIKEIANRLDGFIFTGGPDINPLSYTNHVIDGVRKIVPERDEFEYKLLDEVLKNKKPILGICRGFQLINVFFAGTLYQNITAANLSNISHSGRKLPKYNPCHKVKLDEGSQLFKAFKKKKIWVNSYHHQAIEKLGRGLIPTGWSEDNIIEAFEHKEHKDLFGVQWHPEMMTEMYEEQLNIFRLFIDKVNSNRGDLDGN